MGLKADEILKKWDQRGTYQGRPILEKETRWVVWSGLARTEPVETHVADLLRRIKPYAERIRELAADYIVWFACAICAYSEEDYNPEVVLTRDAVDLISALGARFWVDVYFLADAKEDG